MVYGSSSGWCGINVLFITNLLHVTIDEYTNKALLFNVVLDTSCK